MEAVRTELPSQDEDLIHCYLKTGSRDALDELASRHIARIRGFVHSMVLDDVLTDDLTQEAFLRAFGSLSSFRGRAQFSTWLYRIAMNTVRSYLENQGRSPVVFRSDVPEPPADQWTPEAAAVRSELEGDIQSALSALSPKLRAAIVLTCLQGKSAREAARIEGCSVATMYWRVHAARKQLKQRLARHLI